jgi:hypothetical protein
MSMSSTRPVTKACSAEVDSTAQFFDGFKKPFPGQGIFELYQREAEKLKQQREPKNGNCQGP